MWNGDGPRMLDVIELTGEPRSEVERCGDCGSAFVVWPHTGCAYCDGAERRDEEREREIEVGYGR